jgi:hypothetical protein
LRLADRDLRLRLLDADLRAGPSLALLYLRLGRFTRLRLLLVLLGLLLLLHLLLLSRLLLNLLLLLLELLLILLGLLGRLRRLLLILLGLLGGLRRLLLILLGLLGGLRRLLLASLPRPLLFQDQREILQLGHDPHAAFLVAGVSQRARALDHLLDVFLTLRFQLRLRQLLLDLIESLGALLLLRERGRARQEHEPAAGEKCAT